MAHTELTLWQKMEAFVKTIEGSLHHDKDVEDYAFYLDQTSDHVIKIFDEFPNENDQEKVEAFVEYFENQLFHGSEEQMMHNYFGDGSETIDTLSLKVIKNFGITLEIIRKTLKKQEDEESKTVYSMIYLNIMSSLEWYFSRSFALTMVENRILMREYLEKQIRSNRIQNIRLDHNFRIINTTKILADHLNSSVCQWNNINWIKSHFSNHLNIDIEMREEDEIHDDKIPFFLNQFNLEQEVKKRNHLAHRHGYDLDNVDVRPDFNDCTIFLTKAMRMTIFVGSKITQIQLDNVDELIIKYAKLL
ncbi:MAG: hypothetical protein OCD03_11235 [Hyphomicrobiales bacterium]